MSKGIVKHADVYKCASCGGDHTPMVFIVLRNPKRVKGKLCDYRGYCPVNGGHVYLRND